MIRRPEILTPEEQHAAMDLALYTVNTGQLYPYAQEIMRHLSRHNRKNGPVAPGVTMLARDGVDPAPMVHPQWIGHAKRGREWYQREMGTGGHVGLFFRQHVLAEAACQIAEHYAEEMAEIAAEIA